MPGPSPTVVGVIPARYASTRLPGKPLVDLCGQTMIERVWRSASKSKSIHKVLIATDDERIARAAQTFGAHVVLTPAECASGTDRCYAAVVNEGYTPDVVINIQGDEPLLESVDLDNLVTCLLQSDAHVATLITPLTSAQEQQSPSVVKVVRNRHGNALYFSRAPIPTNWKHIGIYAYRWTSLLRHIQIAPSMLEGAENLEQLRLLEDGAVFATVITNNRYVAIDTPEDVQTVCAILGC